MVDTVKSTALVMDGAAARQGDEFMQRIRLNKTFSLEGTAFDWKLVTHYVGKTKEGMPKEAEKVHYFPRLSQIAQYVVDEQAKDATDLRQLYEIIKESTAQIIEVLGENGYDEVFQHRMEKVTGDGGQEKDEKPAATTNPRRRTRKKTGTDKVSG